MAKLSFSLAWYLFVEVAFGAHFPRQANLIYPNSSISAKPTTLPPSGQFCCQIYAPAVALINWYIDHNVTVPGSTVVTEYLRYNNTIVPTSTITRPPNSAVYLGAYLGDHGETPVIAGVSTDLNGQYYAGAYDATLLLDAADTNYEDLYTTIASPTPVMTFREIYVFSGHLNSAGKCTATYKSEASTYDVASVARSWFSKAASLPFVPDDDETSGISVSSLFISEAYYSFVSTQTTTWNRKVVITEIDDKMFTWLAQNSQVLSQEPSIMSCSPVSAAGAPQLHIRVSFLTQSSAVTSTTNALYINTASITSAAPASSPTSAGPASTKATAASTTLYSQNPVAGPSTQVESSIANPTSDGTTQPYSSVQSHHDPAEPPKSSDQKTVPVVGSTSDQPSKGIAQATSVSMAQPVPTQQQGNTDSAGTSPPQTIGHIALSNQPSPENPKSTRSSPVDSRPSNSADGSDTVGTSQHEGVSPSSPSQEGSTPVESTAQPIQTSGPVVVVIGGVTATALSTGGLDTSRGYEVLSSGSDYSMQATVVVPDTTDGPASFISYAIADQTLVPGGPAIQVSGTTYSLQESGSNVIVNGETVSVSTAAQQTSLAAVIGIGDLKATSIASDVYVVADQTVSRGGPAVQVSGTTYSLASSGDYVAVNGQPQPITAIQKAAPSPATVVIGGITAKPESSGAYYIVADQTLRPGGSAIEISGVTYSLPTSGANVVVNGATHLAGQAGSQSVAAVVLGSVTAVPLLAGAYAVNSQIISPGGSAMDILGTTYSLPASGSMVIINGQPTPIQTLAPDNVLTIGSLTFTASYVSVEPLVIASQTLIPGGSAITVSGTVYSLPPDATSGIVVNGLTTSLASAASGVVELSFGSQQVSFTPLGSGIVVASQTLYPGGPAVTVNGETVSLPAGGSAVVIRSGAETKTQGLGDYVWQGIASSMATSDSGSASVTATASLTRSAVVTSTTRGVVESGETGSGAATASTGAGSKTVRPFSCQMTAFAVLVLLLLAI